MPLTGADGLKKKKNRAVPAEGRTWRAGSGFGSWVSGVVGVRSIRSERISSSQGLKCRLLKKRE